MRIKINRVDKSTLTYLSECYSSETIVDVFIRPDDNDIEHMYMASGIYQASMADRIIFQGTMKDAIEYLTTYSYENQLKKIA